MIGNRATWRGFKGNQPQRRGSRRSPDREGVSVVETKSNKSAKRSGDRGSMLPIMSMSELAKLGGGKVAYIKMMTSDEAREMFPAIEGLPAGINLFALHAADGTPLALTDSHQAAVGHALGDELEIASVH